MQLRIPLISIELDCDPAPFVLNSLEWSHSRYSNLETPDGLA